MHDGLATRLTQNAISGISYDVYKDRPENTDLDAIAPSNFRRFTLFAWGLVDAHFYAAFNHLAGYSSAYYTYMWDKVIAEDFFQQFEHENLLAGETPMRYRREVLEPGGSMSANDLVKNFLGRPQNTTAFQRWIGEEFEGTPESEKARER